MPWNAYLDYTPRLVTMKAIDETGHETTETIQVRDYFILLASPTGITITFSIARRKNKFTLRDERESATGTSGSTGMWGTREASRSGEASILTPTAWKSEVSRLIGSDRAEGVINEYLSAIDEAKARREAKLERRRATVH